MRSTSSPPPWSDVIALAEQQGGVLRRDDLLGLGFHPRQLQRRVRAELLLELHPHVFALGHRAIDRHAQLLAAVWSCGADAALSHASAAAFYEWLPEDTAAAGPIHVTALRKLPARDGVIVHRTSRLDHRHVLTYDLLRVTDRVRTLIDLADHLTDAELRRVADQLPELPLARIAAMARELPGRHGAPRIARLLASEEVRTRSELERRFARYCTRHALPHPTGRNVRVAGHVADCFYAEQRLVVELDGRAYHQRRTQMAADRARDADYQLAGLRILRLVWENMALEDPRAAERLRGLLALPTT